MHHFNTFFISMLGLLILFGCPEEKDEEKQKDPKPEIKQEYVDAGIQLVLDGGVTPFQPDAGVGMPWEDTPDSGLVVEVIAESADGGLVSFWPQAESLFPITGQALIDEPMTSVEGQTCFFDADRFLVMNEVELIYWHWAGLGERHFDVPSGTIKKCITLEDGTPMLMTTETFLLFDGYDWVVSPLSDILDGEILRDVAHIWRSDTGDTFFFAFDSGLAYWERGTIYDVDIASLVTENALLSEGPVQIEGLDKGVGVWVFAGDWVYALTPDGANFDAYIMHNEGGIDDMTTFGAHHLAMVMNGRLYLHDGENRTVYRLPEDVRQVWGHPGKADLFAGGDGPEWWIRPDGNLIQLLNMSSDGIYDLETEGSLFSRRTDGAKRHHLAPYLRWRGLEPGDTLQDNAYISLVYGGWGLPSSITVTHNGEPVTLDMDDGLMLELAGTDSANWLLDDDGIPMNTPAQLFDGAHELKAVIIFEDEVSVEATISFMVGDWRVPTWVEDVEVIYDARCAQCHYDGSATFSLHNYSDWVDDFETIYLALESGQMPMPLGGNVDMLTPLQLEMLQRWQQSGFPETPDDIVIVEPDWSFETHIKPLFDAHCVNCHGPQGGGRSLDERMEWEAEIDNIIDALETGIMPLSADPLVSDDIEVIRAWKEAGFAP